jgi:hypothetical protein
MLGSYVSAAYENAASRETERFYAGLLKWAGVEEPVTVSGGRIEVRWLESGGRKLVFVFNHEKRDVDAVVTIRGAEMRKKMAANEVWFVR